MNKLLSCCLVFMLFGCGTITKNTYNHILSINSDGSPTDPETDSTLTRAEHQQRIKQTLLPETFPVKTDKLLIYLHGGLNTPSTSNARTAILAPIMEEDKYHSVFVNWRSGFFTTYGEHLFSLRQGESWPYFWGPVTSPFVLIEDLGRGIVRTPMVWTYQTNSFIKTISGEKLAIWEEGAKGINVNLNALQASTPLEEKFGELPTLADERTKLDKVGQGLLGGIQLVFGLTTAPIFDAGGTGAWDAMKRRTELMFSKAPPEDGTFNNLDQYTTIREGALVDFFNVLRERQRNNPNLEIVLIGHSMGTIIANNILLKWPDINFSKVIYMGAACTIADFQSMVVPYLKTHRNTRFYNYMLHPTAENMEAHGYGFGGTGSLLNQIDNFYETPVAENQRTLGKYANIFNGIDYFNLPGVKSQIFLRAMPLDADYPTAHGEFDDPKYNNMRSGKFWNEGFGKLRPM